MATTYTALQLVNIRREPRITGSNKVGQLSAGHQRVVFETLTDKSNQTWGRISEPDSAGVSNWVCIRGLNREYMRVTETPATPPASALGLEARIASLEARVARLEAK